MIPLLQAKVNQIILDAGLGGGRVDDALQLYYEKRYGVGGENLPFGLGKLLLNNSDNVEKISDNSDGDWRPSVDAIVGAFRLWRDAKASETRWAVFEKDDEKNGGRKILVVDTSAKNTQRYFKNGRERMKKRLEKRLSNKVTCGVHLTLTFDTKRIDLVGAWDCVGAEFGRFMDAVNVARKRKFGSKRCLGYCMVLEQHRSGYPHVHVWFPGLRWLWDVDDLKRWWGWGEDASVDLGYRDQGSVLRYCLKYVSKLSGWSDVGLAMLWHFGRRVYNVSQSYYVQTAETLGWRYIDVCKSLLGVMAVLSAQGVDDAVVAGCLRRLGCGVPSVCVRSP